MITLTAKEKKVLDIKNQHTTYKIKYVSAYVKNWLFVMSNRKEACNINFIDCMCNAGIYADSDYSTAIEVFKLFYEFAPKHKDKTYNLFLNDFNKERIEIIEKICKSFNDEQITNINYYVENNDVNVYLRRLIPEKDFFGFPHATVLYVDPYDFGTVHIPTLKQFVGSYYCELFYNVFTSDFVRNKLDERIVKCIDNPKIKISTKTELVNYIINELKIHKMKYHLCYEFRITTNTELYQIMFLTPSNTGLDKLKEAYWKIFDGKQYHRNQKQDTSGQMTMFTVETDIEMHLKKYSAEARDLVLSKFRGQIVSYAEIAEHILSNSLLSSSHLLENVIKPLIDNGKIIKLNRVAIKSNYKQDYYSVEG